MRISPGGTPDSSSSVNKKHGRKRIRERLVVMLLILTVIASFAAVLVRESEYKPAGYEQHYSRTYDNPSPQPDTEPAIPLHATPEELEYTDGYTPSGEIDVPQKRSEDHVVRITKPGKVDKYVIWTTGTPLSTSLTIPAVIADKERGQDVTTPISLTTSPSIVLGAPHLSDKHVVDAKDAGLVSDGITDNTPRFNDIVKLLPQNVKKTLSLDSGAYAFKGVLRLASNTTILGQGKTTYIQQPTGTRGRLVIWYPTGTASKYDGMHDVTWKNIYFRGEYEDLLPTQPIIQSIIHANNITVDSCTFDMVQGHLSHLLDVDGSTNITVKNSTIIGSADRGQTFKEAFQMDVAARGATGFRDRDTVTNNLPTSYMTIEKNRFLPLRNTEGKLLLPSGAPFGTHMAYAKTTDDSSYIHNGVFKGNYVEDPVAYKGAGSENSAVIHFDAIHHLTVSDNTFVWTSKAKQPGWAVALYAHSRRMVKPEIWHDITITNNTFERFSPTNGVFDLYRERTSTASGGRSVLRVTVSGNRFNNTPPFTALHWWSRYSETFLVTYGQRLQGNDNIANNFLHLDPKS